MNRSILYLQYTNPANYPPLEHSGLILSNAGWEVWFFGIQSEGESNKLIFPEPLARRQTLWDEQSSGIRQKLQYFGFTLAALWRTMLKRPAWVYCSDLMSCPAALLIGRFTRCKVLYHEHDSPNESNGESRKQKAEITKSKAEILKAENRNREAENISAFQNVSVSEFKEVSAFQRFLLWCRRRVGREADLVVLPNEKRLELFQQATGRQKRSLCVFNCPRREEVRETKAEMLKPEMLPGEVERQMLHGPGKSEIGNGEAGTLRLAFHGSINRDWLPTALLGVTRRVAGRS